MGGSEVRELGGEREEREELLEPLGGLWTGEEEPPADAKLRHSAGFLARVHFEGPQALGEGAIVWFAWPGWEG